MEDLRYPIGRFHPEPEIDQDRRQELIEELAGLPAALREVVEDLSPEQLDTRYRPGGWTVRQVVHHVADSHLHSYIRFKLAVTEDEPAIKAYYEAAWAELVDARSSDVPLSLALLGALHARWTEFLSSLPTVEFQRGFLHPEQGRVTLDMALQSYAWHGRHHVAHITRLRERMRW